MSAPARDIRDYIRTIADFPRQGSHFPDLGRLFADPRGLQLAVDRMVAPFAARPPEVIVGLEAHGFLLGAAMAHRMGTGFVPVRETGRLPGRTLRESYALEGTQAGVEVQEDAIMPGARVLIVDDLLATGGVAEAGIRLVERLGGDITGCAFLVELPGQGGRARIEGLGLEVTALCLFEEA